MIIRFRINSENRVEAFGENDELFVLRKPRGGTRKALLRKIPSKPSMAMMYYFIVKILGIPDTKATERMIRRFIWYGITPEMLCLIDLRDLPLFIRGFGQKGLEILETATKPRPQKK